MSEEVVPFHLSVSDEIFDDLRARLRRTRWPSSATTPGWQQGVPVDYLQDICGYWSDGYDWSATERRLNDLGQFTTEIDGLRFYFLHARSPHASALPLILTHGWPGSVREFLDLIEPLTNPPDPADAFHVVCPSLPGFGFTEQPASTGWGVQRIAAAIETLMLRLGYLRYGAHGGDWGAVITSVLGQRHPDHLAGVHMTIPVVLSTTLPDDELLGLSPFEQAGMDRAAEFAASGSGYLTEMATRPQTLAYGLADSPAAQAAWILEKFYEWTDCDGNPENAVARDVMLDNIMLYWLNRAGASASRIYWESMLDIPTAVLNVPAGCSIFPKEHVRVPRRTAERYLRRLMFWHELPRGGHFASLEVPDLFIDELRTFFRLVR